MKGWSLFGWGLMALAAIAVAGYAIVAYTMFPIGSLVHPAMERVFLSTAPAIQLHVFGSMVALVTGPFQLHPGLRRLALPMHRWMGRAFLLLGVAVGGLAGLFLAFNAFGGLPARAGFTGMALAWLGTGWMAYRAIRNGRIATHRRWMIRCYAVTLAAVTLRIQLGTGQALDIPFATFYPWTAWLSWVPNLFVAEWWLRRNSTPAPRPAGA